MQRSVATNDGVAAYSYDAQNRLTSAQTGADAFSITYDARNRPIKRMTSGGAPIYLVYDGWELIAEYNGSAQVASYVHETQAGEILARTDADGAIWFFHHDSLGSIVSLTSTDGIEVERYSYTAFGQPTIQNRTGTTLASSFYNNRFLFTGREWLMDIGLYDYRNRMYSPQIGRFLQIDPIRFDAKDNNLYRYVTNNPINMIDADGLIQIPTTWPCSFKELGSCIRACMRVPAMFIKCIPFYDTGLRKFGHWCVCCKSPF